MRQDRSGQLGGDVGHGLAGREVPRQREGQRHGRVDVGAREVAGGVDHDHDHQAEDQRRRRPRRARRRRPSWRRSPRSRRRPGRMWPGPRPAPGAPDQARCIRRQLAEQEPHPLLDLVADPAHGLEVLAGGVLELPVLITLARIDRAGVAAAHRDHGVRGADELVGERLRELLGEVDADLGHRLDRGRVDLLGRIRAGGADVHPTVGELVQQSRRHLAPPRVMDADEQDLGHVLGDLLVGLGQGPQPLTGEAMNEQGDEVLAPSPWKLADRLGHVPLDRLGPEDSCELLLERHEPLVPGGPGSPGPPRARPVALPCVIPSPAPVSICSRAGRAYSIDKCHFNRYMCIDGCRSGARAEEEEPER